MITSIQYYAISNVQDSNLVLGMYGTYQILGQAVDVSLISDDIKAIERNANVFFDVCEDIDLAVNIGKTK